MWFYYIIFNKTKTYKTVCRVRNCYSSFIKMKLVSYFLFKLIFYILNTFFYFLVNFNQRYCAFTSNTSVQNSSSLSFEAKSFNSSNQLYRNSSFK